MRQARLKKILRALTLGLLLPLIFSFWLIGTESGLRVAIHYAITFIPGDLSIGKLEGSLIGPITARNIHYKQNSMLVKVNKLTFEWKPAAILTNTINVNKLHIETLNIKLPTPTASKSNQVTVIPEINLPWRIALKNVVLDDINVNQSETNIELKQIKLNATSLFNQIYIKSLALRARNFEFDLNGQLNTGQNYQHKLDINWSADLPEKAALVGKGRIEGNLTALTISQKINGLADLSLKADVRDPLNQLNWQAEVNVLNINPAKAWPEWPGKFKGKVTSEGQTKKGQLIANVEISDFTGKLRDYPVSLHSRLNWLNEGLNISRFDLRSGKTLLSAKGRIDSSMNVSWSLNSNNLSELYPQAQGQLQANGKLTGISSNPKLKMTFNGKALSFPGYNIEQVKGEVDLDLFSWQQVNVKIASHTLNFNGHDVQSLDINAEKNKMQVKVISDLVTALFEIKGELKTPGWQGRIDKADFISPKFDDWKLKSPSTFNLSKDQFLLEPLCWQSVEGNLCITLQNENKIWQSQLKVNKLPLMFMSPLLPPDLKLEGLINATAKFQFVNSEKILGQAHISLPPGAVSYPLLEGERNQWKYHSGRIDVTLNDEGLAATSEIAVSDQQLFKGQLNFPRLKPLTMDSQKQIIQGKAQLNINNLNLLEALVPEINNIKGEVGFNFDLSGTLAQPKFRGNAHLDNGSFRIPRLGLNIEHLRLKSQSDDSGKLDFQLTAHSGEGDIKIQGQTNFDSQLGWPTSIEIKGEKFEVSHIPVSQLIVSPDLKIKIQNHTIDISGMVLIPYAKLQPKDVTTATRVSDDTVVVGDDQPIEKKWSITTKVRLTLGERVHFYGFGFEGRFAGSLVLEDELGQPTKATGEINIPEGRYAAYGQKLNVEHGRILFSGGPVTNPGLDLRAVRKIGAITAGLKVKGPLKKPTVELFSIPVMGQTDTLAYILLGRPIENATGDDGSMMAKAALALGLAGGDSLARTIGERFGLDEMRVESSDSGDQASIIIGRYLSPKLYVGYGVGLVESFNTFNVRYKISDKWQLKGESGEHQGADFLYTIER